MRRAQLANPLENYVRNSPISWPQGE